MMQLHVDLVNQIHLELHGVGGKEFFCEDVCCCGENVVERKIAKVLKSRL